MIHMIGLGLLGAVLLLVEIAFDKTADRAAKQAGIRRSCPAEFDGDLVPTI